MLRYRNFELEIGPVRAEGYPVALLNSPGGQARGILALPDDLGLFERELAELDVAMLADPAADVVALAQHVGGQLFAALLPGELRSLYDVSRSVTREAGDGLRIKLRVNAPELTTLPWEFLFDPRRGAFVALSRHTPLVRYTEVATPDQPLTIAPPLRVLAIAASPDGAEPLDLEAERQRVDAALAPLAEQALLSLTWLTPPTWRALQAALQAGPWHVLHFVGHAELDEGSGEGAILLADDGGEALRLRADQLADLLADQRSLRLAILNACEGARGDGTSLYSSMAATLVQRDLPAVVAMQHAITDTAAIEFSGSFYAALANLYPVDAALAEARKAMSLAEPDSLEWATPVLHLRAPDGMLFVPDKAEEKEGQGGGNVFNIGSMGDGATLIGGDAENVTITQGGDAATQEPDEAKQAETVRRGWFGRLFGRREQGEESPKLVIGGDARNVIVDSRIMQFNVDGRRVTVPIFLVAAALVALLAFLIYPSVEHLWNPSQMVGDFKIAVADFGLLEDGEMQESSLGTDLSNTVYTELDEQYAAVRAAGSSIGNVTLWHDSQGRETKNVRLGLIDGNTPEKRSANAAALAERINADMVIYGFLTSDEEPDGLALEFYYRSPAVAGAPDTATGLYRLGLPIASSVPVTDEANATLSRSQIIGPLTERAQVISWLAQALIYDFTNQSDQALRVLQEAEEQLGDWQNEEGKEILYYFLGRAAYYARNLDEAERASEAALTIEPEYVNAHILRGLVHMDRAQLSFAQGRELSAEEAACTNAAAFVFASPTQEAALADAEAGVAHLREALRLAPNSFWPPIEPYARMNLGLALRGLGLAYVMENRLEEAADALTEAEQHLTAAAESFPAEEKPQYYAWVQMGLGVTHRLQAHLAAVEAFQAEQAGDDAAAVTAREEEAVRLRQTIAAHQACLDQAEATVAYPLFQEKVLTCSCVPFHASAQDALTALEAEETSP